MERNCLMFIHKGERRDIGTEKETRYGITRQTQTLNYYKAELYKQIIMKDTFLYSGLRRHLVSSEHTYSRYSYWDAALSCHCFSG